MEPLWSPWLQPAAISGKSVSGANRQIEPNPLRPVATGCLRSSMVRRGSPVRVRKRAFRKPRKSGAFSSRFDLQFSSVLWHRAVMELPHPARLACG